MIHDIVFATKLLTHLLHQHAVVPTSTKAMTLSSRHSDHKQNGYDSSAETTLGDYEGKNNDDSSTEHSINLLPTTPKKVNSSNAKRNIGKTNEVHESKLSTSMKSPLFMPPVLNRNLVTEKPILTVSKILSPATETLNELSSIDAASASNLRFDFSQLSQLTYEEIDTAKNNDNVISLEVNKTNNDNNVASSNDGETKRSSFHILDKTSATMTSTIKEKTPINISMKQDHLHSFSNNSPKSKCDKNEIDKATELRMKKIQASVNVSSSLKNVFFISFSFSTHHIYYTLWIYFLLSTRNSRYIWECITKWRR